MDNSIRSIAHDYNNDMTFILGALKIAMKETSIDKMKERLVNITKRVTQVSTIFSNILNKSKISLDTKFTDVLKEVDKYGIKYTLNISQLYNGLVDKEIARRCLNNIFKNAKESKATHLNISLSNQHVVIKDNGRGFNRDILNDLNKYIEVTTKKNGHGVGMNSLHKFSDVHNYNLKFTNSLSGGAVIAFGVKEV